MTVIAVHPDSASLEYHMEIAGAEFRKLARFIKLLTIEVYGRPGDEALKQLRQKAQMLGESDNVIVQKPQADNHVGWFFIAAGTVGAVADVAEQWIRVKPKDLAAVGVERVPRVTGVQSGLPQLEDGRSVDVANVGGARDSTPGSPGSTFRYSVRRSPFTIAG